jgi:hypothetical protein
VFVGSTRVEARRIGRAKSDDFTTEDTEDTEDIPKKNSTPEL